MSRTFLGIGAGPIQTGIFVAGAAASGFDRIVLADVDATLVGAIRAARSITVNTACADSIRCDRYENIEIYNPSVPADLEILKQAASEAIVLNTALPATRFYASCAPWLNEAFAAAPDKERFFYTSENSTTAAAELKKLLNDFPRTYLLDTVIGKMSKIFRRTESDLAPLAPEADRGHLVEEFNTIYCTDVPGIERGAIAGVYPKANLHAFEEAKLYGHNASHFVLALLARRNGCRYMSDALNYPESVRFCRQALIEECGRALCTKYAGVDPYFEPENFNAWAIELVRRMTSELLRDSVDRVARDLGRKLAWNDRLIGAIRLCRSQNVSCERLMKAAALAARFFALETLSTEWPQEESIPLLEELYTL